MKLKSVKKQFKALLAIPPDEVRVPAEQEAEFHALILDVTKWIRKISPRKVWAHIIIEDAFDLGERIMDYGDHFIDDGNVTQQAEVGASR